MTGSCAFPDDDDPKRISKATGCRVPRHRFKAGFDYWLTTQWKFGADVVAASDQIFFG